jgi:hypothetical protein
VSRYAVNSLLYRLKKDAAYRARFLREPEAALADVDLTDEERRAFVARDARRINELVACCRSPRPTPSSSTDCWRDCGGAGSPGVALTIAEGFKLGAALFGDLMDALAPGSLL